MLPDHADIVNDKIVSGKIYFHILQAVREHQHIAAEAAQFKLKAFKRFLIWTAKAGQIETTLLPSRENSNQIQRFRIGRIPVGRWIT